MRDGLGSGVRGGGCGLFLAYQSPRDLHSDVFLSGQGGFCLILSDVMDTPSARCSI